MSDMKPQMERIEKDSSDSKWMAWIKIGRTPLSLISGLAPFHPSDLARATQSLAFKYSMVRVSYPVHYATPERYYFKLSD